jgi:hypothetical protein
MSMTHDFQRAPVAAGIFERARRLGECVEASAIRAAHKSSRILKGNGTVEWKEKAAVIPTQTEATK